MQTESLLINIFLDRCSSTLSDYRKQLLLCMRGLQCPSEQTTPRHLIEYTRTPRPSRHLGLGQFELKSPSLRQIPHPAYSLHRWPDADHSAFV